MPKKKTERRSRDDWAKAVAEYETIADQETQEAFAQRKRFNVGTFRYWLYKLREADNEQTVRFVELRASGATTASGDVEIVLGGRYTVRFCRDADAGRIADVVAELAKRLEC
jgi:hypothetical protein